VLYVRGPRGLETGVAGSINTEIIEFAGAENVAASALGAGSLVQFSMEQVFAWNPDWIIAIHPDFMTTAKTDRLWSAVPAVRAGRVALAPGLPFGWVDFPPAVNRLLGLMWLPVLFGLRPRAGLAEAVADFHALFYHRRPEPAQIEALLRPALPA
jgi:iron complex transport system substrate-binding protein